MTPARPALSAALVVGVALQAGTPALAQALAASPFAAAQRPPEILRSLHLAGRNQLGILEYCRAQGAIGDDVIALHRRTLAALPPAHVEGLDAAEEAGRRGVIALDTAQAPFTEAAKAQGNLVVESCRHVARTVRIQAGLPPD